MSKITDERLAEVGTTLNFFASVIKSGETWTATCQRDFDNAHAALSALRAQGGVASLEASPAPVSEEIGLEKALLCLDGEPEYHHSGMGCGLEDRNIHDRYEAMQYGWDQAMERVYSEHINPAVEALTAALEASPAPVSDNIFTKGAPEDVAVMPESDAATQVILRTATEIEQDRLASKASPAPVSEEMVERFMPEPAYYSDGWTVGHSPFNTHGLTAQPIFTKSQVASALRAALAAKGGQ